MLCQNIIKATRLKITEKNLRNTKVNVPLGTFIPPYCTYFFLIPIFLCYMNILLD